jgi:serine/threonine protein kinase
LKAIFRETGEACCLKLFVEKEGTSDLARVNECVSKLIHLKSDYSEYFYGLVQDGGKCYLFHGYYPFTLETILNLKLGLCRNGWRMIMKQMLVSVTWLVSTGYIPVDLNLSTFLVSDITSVKLGRLIDAIAFPDFWRADANCLDYCPPEFILGDRNHAEGYVVWNLACLFFEIVTSHRPFGIHQRNPIQLLNTIMSLFTGTDPVQEPKFWAQLPLASVLRDDPVPVNRFRENILDYMDDPELCDLIRCMLMIDVRQRWRLGRCLTHRFFFHGV